MHLVFLSIVLFIFSTLSFAHKDGAYYHDPDDLTDRSSWMAKVRDDLRITEFSIPGTHGSASYQWEDITNNQILTIKQQLKAGIRYFDLRAKASSSGKVTLYHGPIYLFNTLSQTFKQMSQFLQKNPSETILVRIKQTGSDDATLTKNLSQIINNYSSHIWSTSSSSHIPRLSDVRGKILILQNFGSGSVNFGIRYNNFNIQDDYHLNHNWELYDKWLAVKSHLQKANRDRSPYGYINYLSGSGYSFPYFVASGHRSNATDSSRLSTGLTTIGWRNSYPDFPRTGCWGSLCTISFEGTNTLTRDYLTRSDMKFAGIVAADFPGDDLIEKILNLNEKAGLLKPQEFVIKNIKYNGCLDFFAGIYNPNEEMIINPLCHKLAAQRVTYYPLSKELKVKDLNGKERCIEVKDGVNAHRQTIVSNICNSSASQKWLMNQDKTISSMLSGDKRCLDVDQHSRDRWANLIISLWSCVPSSPDQQFERL